MTDAAGLKSGRVGWDVDVVWSAPQVVRLDPKERKLTLEPGQSRELRAGATSPAKGSLSYEWRLDGKIQPPAPDGRFQLPSDLASGSHTVDVASISISVASPNSPLASTLSSGKPTASASR